MLSSDIKSVVSNALLELYTKPKTRLNKTKAFKELPRVGLDPDQFLLSKKALSQGNLTVIDRAQLEQIQITQLTVALKRQMIREIQKNQAEKPYRSAPEGR